MEDNNKNVLVYLLLIASAYETLTNLIMPMRGSLIIALICFILFLISILYLISVKMGNNNLMNKFKIVGEKPHFICLGLFLFIFISPFLWSVGDTTYDYVGHIDLDDANISVIKRGGEKIETGYWVISGTNTRTKTEYTTTDPDLNQSIKINLKNISWEKPIDNDKFQEAINENNPSIKIKIYDSNDNYLNTYSPIDATVKDSEIIIKGGGINFDKNEMESSDVKYIEVELLFSKDYSNEKIMGFNSYTSYNFKIKSNKYKLDDN